MSSKKDDILGYIKKQSKHGPVQAQVIAEDLGFPETTVRWHLGNLRREGRVISSRGRDGGYTYVPGSKLAADLPPTSVTLYESGASVEDTVALVESLSDLDQLEELIVKKGLPYHVGIALIALYDNDVYTAKSYLEMVTR